MKDSAYFIQLDYVAVPDLAENSDLTVDAL